MPRNLVYRPETAAIADLLYRSRTSQRLSQADVADALGRAQQFVSNIETGKTAVQFVALLDVLEALNYDPHRFLDDLRACMSGGPKHAAKKQTAKR